MFNDKLGRMIRDRVTTLGTGVDASVRRLSTAYDVRGQVFQSTSYDNATVGSGSILNQVQKSYNDFQQLVTEYQSHGGAVNTMSTPKVQYTFADGSDNTIRPLGMVYPNGRELTFDYGNADGIDDSSSRIAAIIDDDTTHLVDYQYLGQNSFVIANNPQPQIEWTLASLTGTDDPDTGDIYSGLDRFGRIKDCRWYNTDAEEDAVRLQYGYDRASNRLWRQDDVARSLSEDFDELYTYDGLQRLKTMQRGLLNGGDDAIASQTYGQCWNLDATENWTGMKQAEGGSSWTLEQARTANTVNEITDITNSVGPTWAVPTYDPAGNMTTVPQSADPENSFTASWDAWNRLVKLVDDEAEDTIAEYQYDAINRRIGKTLYASGVLDQTRQIYLSSSNQVLEERIDSNSDAVTQNVWGLIYIDGLILRDRDTDDDGTFDERRYCLQDANWNTVALTNESGTVTQRFCYQPFGTCEFLEADYATGTNDSDWTTLFTGRELDLESGLYYFRARYLSSQLGVFLGRDPVGYTDGPSLSAAHFIPRSVDPLGMYTIVDGARLHCRKYCTRHPEKWFSECMRECMPKVPDETAFIYWYNLELTDTSWQKELKPCPCRLKLNCDEQGNDVADLEDPNFDPNFNRPQLLSADNKYHPGAKYEVRQKSSWGGAGQQCTYDKAGFLIGSGLAAGTADRYGGTWYNVVGHVQHDVTPFELAISLCEADQKESQKPLEKCKYMLQYFEVRPIPPTADCFP